MSKPLFPTLLALLDGASLSSSWTSELRGLGLSSPLICHVSPPESICSPELIQALARPSLSDLPLFLTCLHPLARMLLWASKPLSHCPSNPTASDRRGCLCPQTLSTAPAAPSPWTCFLLILSGLSLALEMAVFRRPVGLGSGPAVF